jgi:F0F1-type ATP synthase membrane subunit b/b'
LQLAAAGPIDDIIKTFTDQISSIINQGQANATKIQQNAQTSAQEASDKAKSQAQDLLNSFQKNISDSIAAAKEAEPKIKACLQKQNDEYKKVAESTSEYSSRKRRTATAVAKCACLRPTDRTLFGHWPTAGASASRHSSARNYRETS